MRSLAISVFAFMLACSDGPTAADAQEQTLPVEIVHTSGHTREITALAFSTDGKVLATASRDYSIKLWNVTAGLLLRTMGGRPATIKGVTFAADGTEVISITDRTDTIVNINDTATGELKRTIKSPVFDHALLVQSAAFSPDGSVLAAAPSINGATTIELIDAHSGDSLHSIAAMHDALLAFSPDGRYLAATGTDCGLILIDPTSGARVGQLGCGMFFGLLGKPAEYDVFAISQDGRTIAAAAGSVLTQFDVPTGTVRSAFDTGDTVRALAVSPDGSLVVTASYEDNIEIRDSTGKSVRSIEGFGGSNAPLLAFSPDGSVLAAAGGENLVRLWDAKDWNFARPLLGASYEIGGVAVTADGANIASDDSHATVVWDAVEGKLARKMDEDQDPSVANCDSCTIGFSSDGRLLAAGTREATTKAWDVASGRIVLSLRHSSEHAIIPRRSVAFMPSGSTLLLSAMTEGRDPNVKELPPVLYDVSARTVVQTLTGGPEFGSGYDWTYPVAASPDGSLVAAVSHSSNINIFDSQSGKFLRTLKTAHIGTNALAFSSDGRVLASASSDVPTDWIELWDVATGAHIRAMETQSEDIRSLAFSPDNRTLASAGDDRIITLWNPDDGTATDTLPGHDSAISSLVFAANGNLVSGGHDGSVKIWSGGSYDLLATMTWEPSGEWMVFTPEGFFEAEGRTSRLGVVRGAQAYPIDAAYDAFHRPDLVREKLEGDRHGTVKATAAQLDLWSLVAPH